MEFVLACAPHSKLQYIGAKSKLYKLTSDARLKNFGLFGQKHSISKEDSTQES